MTRSSLLVESPTNPGWPKVLCPGPMVWVCHDPGKLDARTQAELPENLPQVVINGMSRDEQLGRGFPVGKPIGDVLSDAPLRNRQRGPPSRRIRGRDGHRDRRSATAQPDDSASGGVPVMHRLTPNS